MQDFIEERFPTDISFGSIGGPMYQTSVIENQFGVESRHVILTQARHIYNVSYGIRNQLHMNKLLAFFHNCMGKAIGFRFKDWNDYQIQDQQIAIADGKTTTFEICKEYSLGNKIIKRRIHKPVQGTIRIQNFQDYSGCQCDYTKGILAFKVPPKAGTKIVLNKLEFDTPVRFDTDSISAKLVNKNLREIEPIRLVEVKL